MGGVISIGPSSLSERKKKLKHREAQEDRKRKQAEQEQERRRRLLEEYGVLIPPVFLANKTDDPPLSSRVWERVQRESQDASDLLSWAYRRRYPSDTGPLLGQTLLTEYMTPGLFLSLPVAASGANDGGRFVAALTQNASGLPSFVSLTKRFQQNSLLFFPFPWKVETFLPQHALLSTKSSPGVLPSSMRFVADLSSPSSKNQTKVAWTTQFVEKEGNQPNDTSSPVVKKLKGSWIEAETTREDCWNSGITMRMAAGMTLDSFVDHILLEACRAGNNAYNEYSALESRNSALGDFLREHKKQDGEARIRMAAEYKESILASSTNLSLPSLLGNASTPVVTASDTLLSLNLNGGESDDTPSAPPLWLTLKQSKGFRHDDPSSFSLNLSQVITFDREIWNILEDRAPKVRNHVGWVCQIERFLNSDTENEPKSTSVLSLGASAQLNRNIAGKVVLESKLGSSTTTESATSTASAALKFAVVLKRWLEPQASLSVINKIDLLTGKFSFLGVGLEIEQSKASSKQPSRSTRSGGAEYRSSADMDATASVAPPTRVELPSEKKQ